MNNGNGCGPLRLVLALEVGEILQRRFGSPFGRTSIGPLKENVDSESVLFV